MVRPCPIATECTMVPIPLARPPTAITPFSARNFATVRAPARQESDASLDPMTDMRCRSCRIIIGPVQETVFSPICRHFYRAEYVDAVAARVAWDCQFVVDVLRVQGVVNLWDFAFLAPDGVCIHAARHQGATSGGFFSGPLIVTVLSLSKHMASAFISNNSICPYL